MTIRSLLRSVLYLSGILLCLLLAGTTFGQKFSNMMGQKLTVKLNRKLPSVVHLTGTAISVRTNSQVQGGMKFKEKLATFLESELFSHDTRLRPEPNNPDTIISCVITDCPPVSIKPESRQSSEYRKTPQKWNEKKRKYETEIEKVQVTKNFTVIRGSMNISYQVTDRRTKAILDSGNFTGKYLEEFPDGNGAPPPAEVEEQVMRSAVRQIVPRLVPTTEPVEVMLARGKLDDAGKLGQAGLWEKMSEALEKMEGTGDFKKPENDAYRIYDLGVANEALAYKFQGENMKQSYDYLLKASINYNKAIEVKPDEKYFREPLVRIEKALEQYQSLAKRQSPGRKTPPGQSPVSPSASRAEPPGGKSLPTMPSKALTNQDVIELAQAGLDEENLIAQIKEAPAVSFDLGPQAVMNLVKNKVSNRVISAMRIRQAALTKTPRSTPGKRKQ